MYRVLTLAILLGIISTTPVQSYGGFGLATELNTNCNHTLTVPTTFSSPNYPDYYPLSTSCVYTLMVQPTQKILLTVGPFNTEPCCDYLMIYDGPNLQSQALVKYSGSFQSRTIQSSGNTLTLHFYSDLTLAMTGFQAVFQAV